MLSYLPVLSLLLTLGGNHCKNDTDYCSLSCGRKKNVCCLNPPGEPGVNCRDGFRVIHMSNIDRHLIITHHNVLRNYVAAGKMGGIGMERARVSNMRALSYSRELEYTASCWAFKCSTSFSRCRRTAAHLVGENVCILVGKILEADRIARTMLKLCPMYFLSGKPNESADMLFDPGEDEYQQNLMAQQIVLASARFVGCFRTTYDADGYEVMISMICHYEPSAEDIPRGQELFERGVPCSKCGPQDGGCNSNFKHLCGKVRSLDDDKFVRPSRAGQIRGGVLVLSWTLTSLYNCAI